VFSEIEIIECRMRTLHCSLHTALATFRLRKSHQKAQPIKNLEVARLKAALTELQQQVMLLGGKIYAITLGTLDRSCSHEG